MFLKVHKTFNSGWRVAREITAFTCKYIFITECFIINLELILQLLNRVKSMSTPMTTKEITMMYVHLCGYL